MAIDVVTYKRLVAAGNDEIWIEGTGVSAGTLTELTAANGDIDTSDQLTMFEAYQKIHVVNGANLKVADFINTKLTHGALATAHAKADILTQAGTSAKMVVDFTNTTKTATYGYVTTGTFNAAGAVTGSGSGTGFTPSAVTSSPHWYDWTVYPGGASGTMPEKAYLSCLYRGRGVLAGNPDYPYQWWMSKLGDLWNFAFTANDPLSAVSGGNADAGEIGDIIRCLAPYKDDYLIFGCANSIWVMRGDPVAGGSLDEVDLTIGIYGTKSWCFDGGGNMYFWGSGGIYKLPRDFGPIENLSALRLPELISDEAADPSTHRITMEYDRKRNGLFISITKVTDGTNSCYWYDLALKSFYPESYPEECGAYSQFYYDANDTDYKDLLVGCKDGYIRKFDDSQKDDDIGATDEAINSYVALPVTMIGNTEEDKRGKLTSLVFELGGGASSGAHSDTDGLSYEIHVGDDAETVIEDIKDGATAFASGTLSGTGRKTKIRVRARAMYLGIKIYNSTASETWVLNRLLGDIKPAGKLR